MPVPEDLIAAGIYELVLLGRAVYSATHPSDPVPQELLDARATTDAIVARGDAQMGGDAQMDHPGENKA